MSWDNVMLTILAVSGAAMLVLGQVRELLVRLQDIIEAWHEVRRSLRGQDDGHDRLRNAHGSGRA